MIQKTFETNPSNALNKIAELKKDGWTIIATANTSTPSTSADAHGMSYGGPSFSILAERQYDKPRFIASSNSPFAPSMPCNPPGPGRR